MVFEIFEIISSRRNERDEAYPNSVTAAEAAAGDIDDSMKRKRFPVSLIKNKLPILDVTPSSAELIASQ